MPAETVYRPSSEMATFIAIPISDGGGGDFIKDLAIQHLASNSGIVHSGHHAVRLVRRRRPGCVRGCAVERWVHFVLEAGYPGSQWRRLRHHVFFDRAGGGLADWEAA